MRCIPIHVSQAANQRLAIAQLVLQNRSGESIVKLPRPIPTGLTRSLNACVTPVSTAKCAGREAACTTGEQRTVRHLSVGLLMFSRRYGYFFMI
jgi:hypothetical protein